MLTTYRKLMERAYREHWAIGAFNTSNLELTQAIVEAAEELKAPVLVNTSEKAIDYAGLEAIAAIVRSLAQRTKAPVVLNLDHGRSYERAKACLGAGYTGIMIDGSKLSYPDNVELTRKVVLLCRRKRVGVEGELGSVGGREDYVAGHVVMTDPAQAADFIRKTGVDLLAVAIGNAHGIPVPDERLDFERLKAIREHSEGTPLVLHGASSTPDRDIRHAIELGVVKINIDTDLRVAFTKALRRKLGADEAMYDPRDLLTEARKAVKEVVKEKIVLFGSAGKA